MNENHLDFLWVERHRPSELEDFVLEDHVKDKIGKWLDMEIFPHLILHGQYGTGKTSLVKFLLNKFDCDVLEIGKDMKKKGVDIMRGEIDQFLKLTSFSKFKVVVFHEGEQFSPQAQESLKESIEVNSDDTRIIFTTNHIEKLNGALVSRCEALHIEPPSPHAVAKRVQHILDVEGVEVSDEQTQELWKLVKDNFPDIRSTIKQIDNSVYDGVLNLRETKKINQFDDIIELMKSVNTKNKIDKFYEIRKIVNSLPSNNLQNIYEFLFYSLTDIYNREEYYYSTTIIAEYQYKASFDVDIEINVSAMIQELIEIKL